MNITFLIGNGFDLACGLPTSYADVYEEYIKQPSESLVVKKFKEDLIANKTKEKWGNWADFEMGMADYAQNFETEKDFIECVSDFKFFLTNYLNKIEKNFYNQFKVSDDIRKEFTKIIDNDIVEFYLGISKNVTNKLKSHPLRTDERKFINFNYTKVFDGVLNKSSFSNSEIIHIHGQLDENNLAIGVNDVNQIQAKFTLTNKGKRVFIKPFFNEEYDEEKMQEAMRKVISSDCICVFGLSLGESDLMWKKGIVNWLIQNKENHLFIYDYQCSNIKVKDVALKLNEEDDQKEIILKRLGIFTEDCSFLDQVHIPIGRHLFRFIELIKAILEKNSVAKSA